MSRVLLRINFVLLESCNTHRWEFYRNTFLTYLQFYQRSVPTCDEPEMPVVKTSACGREELHSLQKCANKRIGYSSCYWMPFLERSHGKLQKFFTNLTMSACQHIPTKGMIKGGFRNLILGRLPRFLQN